MKFSEALRFALAESLTSPLEFVEDRLGVLCNEPKQFSATKLYFKTLN